MTTTANLRAEWRRFTTTRTGPLLVLGTIATAVLAAVGIWGQDPEMLRVPITEQTFVFFGGMTRTVLVILGIRMVTDEYRHGTAVSTFTATPKRHRVLTAKAILAGAIGSVAGALAELALLATAGIGFAQKGVELDLAGHAPALVLAAGIAGLLWPVIGVGVGALVRHQVAATVGAVLWVALLEQMIQPNIGTVGEYLPVTASYPLAAVPSTSLALTAAAILAAWGAALLIGGGLVEGRRDIV